MILKERIKLIDDAIFEALSYIAKKDYISYILLIGNADVVHGLKEQTGTDCVVDYQMDRYYDETTDQFYIHYLNRNYTRDGFRYEGKSGIDDLSIEMMIYCHLWASDFFLKMLIRLASIVNAKGYLWEVEIPEQGFYGVMKNQIIAPLRAANLQLSNLLESSYSTVIRNAFAHSLYSVDVSKRQIYTRSNHEFNTYTFEAFQEKFLTSILLKNHLGNMVQMQHDEAAKLQNAITECFMTPDGVKVQVFGKMIQRGNRVFPEFRMCKIID